MQDETTEHTGTGAVIREYRDKRGLSQEQVAASLGWSQAAVSRLERDRPLKVWEARALCELLRIPRHRLWAAAEGVQEVTP